MRFEKRPWGWFWTIFQIRTFWVKLIHVHGRTSVQVHKKRTELHLYPFWFALVKPMQIHSLSKGNYIELAWGEPLEEDITRIGDLYGRS